MRLELGLELARPKTEPTMDQSIRLARRVLSALDFLLPVFLNLAHDSLLVTGWLGDWVLVGPIACFALALSASGGFSVGLGLRLALAGEPGRRGSDYLLEIDQRKQEKDLPWCVTELWVEAPDQLWLQVSERPDRLPTSPEPSRSRRRLVSSDSAPGATFFLIYFVRD
jgi:hypothetical protein